MCPSSSGDRASASGAESRRFESYLGHHSNFPRTRWMRVFFFRQERAIVSLPPPNTPTTLPHTKSEPASGLTWEGHTCLLCNAFTRAMPGRRELPLLRLDLFSESAAILTDKRSGPPKATASSNRPISRNGLQRAAWQCSQPHRQRTTRQAPRYRCLRD